MKLVDFIWDCVSGGRSSKIILGCQNKYKNTLNLWNIPNMVKYVFGFLIYMKFNFFSFKL